MPSFKGHFDGTSVVLDEPAALEVGQAVRVEVEEPAPAAEPAQQPRRTLTGFAKGWFEMSDDFNDPIDDFAEHV
jgi:hypothetical protein